MVKKAEGVIIIFLQKKSPYSLSIFGFKWHQQKVVCPVWDEKKKHQQRQRHTKEILCSCPAHSQCQCLLSSSPQCDEEWKRWEGARDEKSCTKKALSGILSLSSSVWRGKGGRGGSCFILLLLDPSYTTKEEKEVQNLMLGHRLYIKDEHGFHVQQGASPLVVKRPVWRQSWRG